MSVEVVDLLSSSSESPPPPPVAAYPKGPVRSSARALTYEVFDLTDGSPQLPPSKKRAANREDVESSSKHLLDEAGGNQDSWFLSNDFGTSVDSGSDAQALRGTSGNKRKKMSPNEDGNKPPMRSLSGRDKPKQRSSLPQAEFRQTIVIDDPIEFTSSPDRSKPTSKKRTVDDEWDPFASSSPRPTENASTATHPTAEHQDRTRGKSQLNPGSGTLCNPNYPSLRTTARKSPPRAKEWDPISSSGADLTQKSDPFASSPPRTKGKSTEVISLDDSSDHSDQSDDEFPSLSHLDFAKLKSRAPIAKSTIRTASMTSKPTKSTAPAPTAASNPRKSAEERQREREEKAAAREAERERKRQERETAKEQRAKDRERAAALAEVNKVRTNKKTATPEMIVDLPSSLGAGITEQVKVLHQDLDVEHTSWDSPVENVVKWRRKVTSEFNEELGLWEPTRLRIEDEPYALVILTAEQFVELSLAEPGFNLEAHVLRVKPHFKSHQLIYLIEGLTVWMRRNRNLRNRQFVSAVRNNGATFSSGPSNQSSGRRRPAQQAYISEDGIEDALLQLQVMHGVLIHHTATPIETAQWLAVFTQNISIAPYRKRNDATNLVGFCMESGQVRTGDDNRDTYVKMLQQIGRITVPIAYGIAAEFETVSELVKGLEYGGPLVLENCRKSTNKDGSFSDRTVGQSISKRIHKVFTGRDQRSTDV